MEHPIRTVANFGGFPPFSVFLVWRLHVCPVVLLVFFWVCFFQHSGVFPFRSFEESKLLIDVNFFFLYTVCVPCHGLPTSPGWTLPLAKVKGHSLNHHHDHQQNNNSCLGPHKAKHICKINPLAANVGEVLHCSILVPIGPLIGCSMLAVSQPSLFGEKPAKGAISYVQIAPKRTEIIEIGCQFPFYWKKNCIK